MENYWKICRLHDDAKHFIGDFSKETINKLGVNRIFLTIRLKALENQSYVKSKRTRSVKVCWGWEV